MGIGKTFKKIGKKVKKGAKKATGAVSNTAKDVAKDVADGAKDVVDEVGKGVNTAVDAAGKTAEKIGDQASKLADTAFDEALQLGEAAWNATVDAIEHWLGDALVDLLLDAAMDVYRRQRPLVDAMIAGGKAILTDAKAAADFERVVTAAAAKKRDPKAEEAMRALIRRPEIQMIAREAGKFDTLSLGLAGSAAFGAGAEGCFGYAGTLPDAKQLAGFYGVGAVLNSVGGSMCGQLGVWTPAPADFKGPYFAATLEVEIKGGGGIQIIFALPTDESGWLNLVSGKTIPGPVGIVVFLGGGGEVSASVSGGYTWVF